MTPIFLGIDIGSTTVKVAVVDQAGALLDHAYVPAHGQPGRVLYETLACLGTRWDWSRVAAAGLTGSGSGRLAPLLGGLRVNELVAQTRALQVYAPHARTVIEMGGQDSKLLLLEAAADGHLLLADFAMNALCAAGTGSFLDQQAARLGLSLGEMAALALRAEQPARLAGRCTVFARSDMVHLQQRGVLLADIVAGLCLAVARNFCSLVGRGKGLRPPFLFQGGVAHNAAMVWAFEQVLGLERGELTVPPYCALMAAIGAGLEARQCADDCPPFRGPDGLVDLPSADPPGHAALPPLGSAPIARLPPSTPRATPAQVVGLGVDVGSVATKAVLLDAQGCLLVGVCLPTAGRPLEAAEQAVRQAMGQLGGLPRILARGVTGSGRRLVAQALGAELACDEVSAQARAALACDPAVETVFEIGGQDSKYIRLQNGVVVDMALNKACAAGTGAFLDEQAGRLGLTVEELGALALQSTAPVDLGERCTVFMESDLVHHQQQGAQREELAAGLAYSIARNYLQRVVQGRPVGERLLFQGGVAANPAVVAAFERLLGRPIEVPPHHVLSGAIGAALLAMEAAGRDRQEAAVWPDLFAEREALLLCGLSEQPAGRPRIGIPRVLAFYDLLPYWVRFFQELGWQVVLSPPTTAEIAARAATEAAAEACMPVRLAYGHVLSLLDAGVERVFLPGLVNRADPLPGQTQSYSCPYVQAIPHLVQAALDMQGCPTRLLQSPLHFLWPRVLAGELRALADELGVSLRQVKAAHRAAQEAQQAFAVAWRRRGEEVLASLPADQTAVVIVGRPYSLAEPALNGSVPQKLRQMGVPVLPMDLLPLEETDIGDLASNMFWHSGQRILAAARLIRRDPRLRAVYLTHFACGPDSFLLSFFRQAMAGKPFLELELDDHGGDAGLETRLEAFLAMGGGGEGRTRGQGDKERRGHATRNTQHVIRDTPHVYIPNVCDPAQGLAAAMRAYGLRAEVLPPSSEETLALGRALCLGRECLPCYTIVGDIVHQARQPGFEPARSVYLVPTSAGPCRLGQFHDLLRQILERLGLGELCVVAPSAENGYQYEGLGVPPLLVGRLAWQGLVAINLLEKFLHRSRPYEREPGNADRLYEALLQRVVQAVEGGGGRRLVAVMEEAARGFAALPVDRSTPRPLIGLVGEIYLRLNPFTNQQIIRRVEALGGEVWLAPMMEWLYYANSFARFAARAAGRTGDLARLFLALQVQRWDERRLLAPVEAALPNAHEPTIAWVHEAIRPYFHPTLRTEAPLSIGKAIDFARRGADGILNVMPFTCMPGTVVAALAQRVRADCGGIPWLDVGFDGLGETNLNTRLEAFLHQARQFRQTRLPGSISS